MAFSAALNSELDGMNGEFGSTTVHGLYRARVEDNKDPMKIGRVRIRIPKVHGIPGASGTSIGLEGLPWATPCFMGAGYGYGSFMVPEVGEYVFVGFESGDSSRPVYLGSCYGKGASSPKPFGSLDPQSPDYWSSEPGTPESPEEAQSDSTAKILYKTHEGSIIKIAKESGKEVITVEDPREQKLTFTEDGIFLGNSSGQSLKIERETDTITLKSGDKEFTLFSRGDFEIKVGIARITSDGETVTIHSNTTQIDSPNISIRGLVSIVGDLSVAESNVRPEEPFNSR